MNDDRNGFVIFGIAAFAIMALLATGAIWWGSVGSAGSNNGGPRTEVIVNLPTQQPLPTPSVSISVTIQNSGEIKAIEKALCAMSPDIAPAGYSIGTPACTQREAQALAAGAKATWVDTRTAKVLNHYLKGGVWVPNPSRLCKTKYEGSRMLVWMTDQQKAQLDKGQQAIAWCPKCGNMLRITPKVVPPPPPPPPPGKVSTAVSAGPCEYVNGASQTQITGYIVPSGKATIVVTSGGSTITTFTGSGGSRIVGPGQYHWSASAVTGYLFQGASSGDFTAGSCAPPPPQFGCIVVQKTARDPEGTQLSVVPQFTFRLDGGSTTAKNNSSGVARFNNVPVGNHSVTEDVPPGWHQVSASGGIVVTEGSNCALVSFTNQQNSLASPTPTPTPTATPTASPTPTPQFGCIVVQKTARDPEGTQLSVVPQFTFRLDGGSTTAKNNSSGSARFNNVPTGTHSVTEDVPPGWRQVSNSGSMTVSAGSTCAVVNITNQQNPV